MHIFNYWQVAFGWFRIFSWGRWFRWGVNNTRKGKRYTSGYNICIIFLEFFSHYMRRSRQKRRKKIPSYLSINGQITLVKDKRSTKSILWLQNVHSSHFFLRNFDFFLLSIIVQVTEDVASGGIDVSFINHLRIIPKKDRFTRVSCKLNNEYFSEFPYSGFTK